jgi:hypothetical protein
VRVFALAVCGSSCGKWNRQISLTSPADTPDDRTGHAFFLEPDPLGPRLTGSETQHNTPENRRKPMFLTRTDRNRANALVVDFAIIARIEASLMRGAAHRPLATRGTPDFSRLKQYMPDLKI